METTRRVAIINLPWGFGTIWSVAKPLIPERTLSKINIVTDRSENQKQLSADLPIESIEPSEPMFDIRPVISKKSEVPSKAPQNTNMMSTLKEKHTQLEELHREALNLLRKDRGALLEQALELETDIEKLIMTESAECEERDEWSATSMTLTGGWQTPAEVPDDEDYDIQMIGMGELGSALWQHPGLRDTTRIHSNGSNGTARSGDVRNSTDLDDDDGMISMGHISDLYGTPSGRRRRKEREPACQCALQ